ncbi:hypothetical protein QBC36DRAFT_380285 [Triangularia setosa]|uniref:Ankyrin n=1 Tax=Triangularia setosa TaxID=2587417 RepID=A0AAN6W304_9PEZI|nr:hypothetical protein QBC36DRAFT_380285 [Podospora setosa]
MHSLRVNIRGLQLCDCIACPFLGQQDFPSKDHQLFQLLTEHRDSATLLDKILESGIRPDIISETGDTPLHYIHPNHSRKFVKLLTSLYPQAERRDSDNCTPCEVFLVRVLSSDMLRWHKTYEAFEGFTIRDKDGNFVQQLPDWEFFCKHLHQSCVSWNSPKIYRMSTDTSWSFVIAKLADLFLEKDHVKDYECCTGKPDEDPSGIAKLMSSIMRQFRATRLWGLIQETDHIQEITQAEKLRFLIEKGVDANLKTSSQFTALVHHLQHSSPETARVLLDANADPNLLTGNVRNALVEAVSSDQVDFLRRIIAKPDLSLNWNQQCHIHPKSHDPYYGCAASHVAAYNGSLNAFTFLVDNGVAGDLDLDEPEAENIAST